MQYKKQRLRIAKPALLCLKKKNLLSQSNLQRGHEFSDFRKKAIQDSSYKKKTTNLIYC